MDGTRARLFGFAAVLGAVFSVLAAVPGRWYGVPQTDSFVFHPDPFTGLWIQRAVIPGLTAVASACLVVGLAGLVLRDRPVAGRLRRWGGVGTVIGLTLVALSLVGFTYLSTGRGAIQGEGADVLSLAVGGIGLLVLVPSLVSLIVGYASTARPLPGYALGGAAILTPIVSYVGFGAVSGLVATLPLAAAWTVLGVELWSHPDPVGQSDHEGDGDARAG